MARPTKKVEAVEQVVKTQEFETSTVSKSEFDDFKNQMMTMMSQMLNQQKQEVVQKVESDVKEVRKELKKEIADIRPFPSKQGASGELPEVNFNKMIRIMSIVNGGMTLHSSTRSYRFEGFGTIQTMTYSELLDVISKHPLASTEGYFLILDADAIDSANMRRHYDKFVTPEVIENILEYDLNVIREVFTDTTKQIKETTLEFIYKKLDSDEYIDKNKVNLIGELTGVNIEQYAKYLKDGADNINITIEDPKAK